MHEHAQHEYMLRMNRVTSQGAEASQGFFQTVEAFVAMNEQIDFQGKAIKVLHFQ